MRRVLLLLTLLLVIAFLGARWGWSYLARPMDVSALIRDSNLIVVGEVTDVWEDGQEDYHFNGVSESGRLMRACLRIYRVLKGDAVGQLSFAFLRSNLGDSGLVSVDKGEFGMFFFRDSDDGLIFTSHFYPKIIAGQEECVTTGKPIDRVAGELACVIQSSTSAVFERLTSLRALATVLAPSATEVLQRAARELPSPLNLLAAIELAQRNDISAMPLVEEGARTSPKLKVSDKEHTIFEYHWGGALKGIKDPAAIPALARLLTVADSEIRQGAVEGLRNTGSEAAIEPLSQALYDSNIWVRWESVMGLAEITHQKEWYPFWDDFKDNEQLYLDYWKAWATQRFSNGH
ncbi:MAG: HEAT repeat domain-containing protein [Terriglobia bacterium]